MKDQVTIDTKILNDKTLGLIEKIFYIEIAANEELYDYIDYFRTKYHIPDVAIAGAINNLIAKNLIKKKSKRNSYLIIPTTDEYKKFIDKYFKMYNDKAFEILGSRYNKSGKKYYPKWGDKEGKLLKADLEQYGYKTLLDYAILFFYDKVDSVKNFTRIKQKAGYGYNVFHAMIDKLELSGIKVPEKCPACGMYWGHAKDCKIILEKRKKEEEERQKLLAIKEKYKDISLIEMFNNRFGRKII